MYRARRDGKIYAVKMSKTADPDGRLLKGFRTEATILAQINHPALVQTQEVGSHHGHPYIVMEYLEGELLSSRLKRGKLPGDEIYTIALKLADVLHSVHSHGVIHQDLKPENIYWNPKTGVLKLFDFGLVGTQGRNTAGQSIGTLDYMSPEQLGILDRPIDARSDLYSLGVTLLECVAERMNVPQIAGRSVEAQFQYEPTDILRLNEEIKYEFAKILCTLLKKDPDDRFASADELFTAINRKVFHRQDTLSKQEHLVGRESEKELLYKHWEDCLSGRGSSILVEGEAGAGKSALVSDLVRRAQSDNTISLRGKCTQRLPFAPLRRFFAEIQKTISHGHPAYSKLGSNFVDKSASIRRISPALADHFGLGEGDIGGNQDRFFEEIADVFVILSRYLPVILFIDDIQWIDAETMRTLDCLSPKLAENRILLVMTSRSSFEYLDSLQLFEERFKVSRKISLGSLTPQETNLLVQAYSGNQSIEERFLTHVHTSTGGLPFSVGELLRNISLNGVLAPNWGKLEVQWDQLYNLDLPSDVIELVRRRISSLSETTREVLCTASIVGVSFNVALLSKVTGKKESVVLDALTQGHLQFLVEPTTEGEYKFIHDRVHEAFRAQLEGSRKRELHQKIALTLLETRPTAAHEVFSMADHFWDGYPEQNTKEAYEISVAAGKLASESHALEKAYEYFLRAEGLAAKAGLDPVDPELIGAICTKIGKKAEAIERYQAAIDRTSSKWLRARILGKMAETYVTNLETAEGLKLIERAFAEIDLVPPHPVRTIVSIVWGVVRGLFGYWTGIGYGNATGEKREQLKIIVNLHAQFGFVKFFDLQPLYMVYSGLRNLHNVNRIGDSAELVNLYCNLYLAFGILKIRPFYDSFYRRARLVAERLADPQLIAHVEAYYAFAIVYAGKEVQAENRVRQLLHDYKNSLITEDYVYLCGVYMSSLVVRGFPEKALKCALSGIEHLSAGSQGSEELRSHYMTWCQSYAVASLVMMGRSSEAQYYLDVLNAYFREHPNDKYHLGIHLNNLIQAHLEQGEYSDAPEREFSRHNGLIRVFIPLLLLHLRHFYIAKAYLRFNQMHFARRENTREKEKAFKKALWELKLACDNPMFSSHYYTLRGAYLAYKGKNRRALRSLNKAERLAFICNNSTALYFQQLTKARMEKKQGGGSATSIAQTVYAFCKNHGWAGRQWEIEKEFADVRLGTGTGTEPAQQRGRPSDEVNQSQVQEMDALLTINLALASARNDSERGQLVLDKVMHAIGAERGAFFLWDDASNRLSFSLGQSSDGKSFNELKGYSSTVVDKVFRTQQPIIVSGTEEGEAMGSASITLFDLRSIIAAPVSVNEKRFGVIYLDSRFAKGIFNARDLDFLRAVGIQIAIGIDSNRSARISVEKVRIEKELELTGAVQRLLIPKSTDLETDRFHLSYFFQTASQSGGDWIWYQSEENGDLTILLGDVVGHGPAAAMITAIVSGTYHALRETADTPVILERIDQVLKDMMKGEYWISLLVVRVLKDKIEVYNAGMPYFSFLKKGKAVEQIGIPSCGPLGLDVKPVKKTEIPFAKGDRFMVCTDGAFEFAHKNGIFGERRLNKLFSSTAGLVLPEARNKIAQTVLSEIAGPVPDDVALAIVEKK